MATAKIKRGGKTKASSEQKYIEDRDGSFEPPKPPKEIVESVERLVVASETRAQLTSKMQEERETLADLIAESRDIGELPPGPVHVTIGEFVYDVDLLTKHKVQVKKVKAPVDAN